MNDLNQIRSLQQRIALYEDMQAYQAIYDLFYHNLHRFCYSFVKSPEIAEEIVSEVFIKLWQIRNKLMEIGNLKVYLYQFALIISPAILKIPLPVSTKWSSKFCRYYTFHSAINKTVTAPMPPHLRNGERRWHAL
ncbi:hypothetical protein A3860_25485 [Niastella vici]|uniref:RNA polymerase sigma-70 region 2 domain-containing protein n=1 Tax=Niastella vici TaxID=1703345 RepID=A0A1V9FY16_9BACT|nr:sigma factor [Niastella vici]OQP63245.1 hypothetical protein A3860_25485 [Niastella vici]